MSEAKPTWRTRAKNRGQKVRRSLERDPMTPIFVSIVALFFIMFLIIPIISILSNAVYYDNLRYKYVGDNDEIYSETTGNTVIHSVGYFENEQVNLYALRNDSVYIQLSVMDSEFVALNYSKTMYYKDDLGEYYTAYYLDGDEYYEFFYLIEESEVRVAWSTEAYKQFDFSNIWNTITDETYFNLEGDGTPLFKTVVRDKFDVYDLIAGDMVYYKDNDGNNIQIDTFGVISSEIFMRESDGDYVQYENHDFLSGYYDGSRNLLYNNSGVYVEIFVLDGDDARIIIGTPINNGDNHAAIWQSPYTDKYLYVRGESRGAILNSIFTSLLTTIFSLIVGTAIAFIMARHEFPGKELVSITLLLPLIIPPFVSGIGFYAIFGEEGIMNQLLSATLHRKLIISGMVGIVYVQTSHFFTLIYLNVYSSLLNVDSSLEEQAENMGSSGFHLFRTITFPLALPGIAAGAILVFILALEDLGTPLVFAAYGGDSFARETVTFKIYEKFKMGSYTSGVDAQSAVLGLFLIVFAFIGFMMIRKYVTLRKYAMISKGRAGGGRMEKASPKKLMIFYPFFLIIFMLSTVTHMGIILTSLTKNFSKFPPDLTGKHYEAVFGTYDDYKSQIINPTIIGIAVIAIVLVIGLIKELRETSVGEFVYGFFKPKEGGEFNSIDYSRKVVTRLASLTLLAVIITIVVKGDTEYMPFIKNTLKYSLIATGVIIVLATIAAYSVARKNFPGKDWFDALITIPIAIPGVVLGLGYLTLFGNTDTTKIFGMEVKWLTLNPFIFVPTILIFSYTIRKFPFTVRSVFSGLQQTDEVLEEAALNLGAGRLRTLFEITVPMIIMNVVAGALVSLVYCLTEVSTTLILVSDSGSGTMT
ncbi:MAG: ABC transporter permease, partial [Candidatus Kariarchaeaceae archaeon]